MKCAQCQAQNAPTSKFCSACGAALLAACPSCGSDLELAARFCSHCGHPVASPTAAASPTPAAVPTAAAATAARFGSPRSYTPKHLAEKILTSRSAQEGERKQVTVLFADIKGSMDLLAERDPEDARKLLDPIVESMMEAVHQYEGTVNQVLGDGIMALFGAPLAHEDHAVRACYAALRMQAAIKRYDAEVGRTAGVSVQIRVGINSGMVIVRSIESDLHMDYTAVGQTVHLAARMEQMAQPGSILVTGNVMRLVEGYVQVKALEPTAVKGLTTPVDVYEVVGTGPVQRRMEASVRRGLSPFVGRARELEFLQRAVDKTRRGHGEIVTIVGEAGMGKSRLLLEFRRSLRAEPISYLEGVCVTYGSRVPFLPLLQMLRATCRLTEMDRAAVIADKVRRRLEWLGMNVDKSLPYLLRLLGVKEGSEPLARLTPEAIDTHTFEILRQMSINGSRRRPLILVIEDVHSIDNASERYLASLVDSLPGAPILLLLTHRPGYRQPWMDRSFVMRLALRPLSSEEALQVLDAAAQRQWAFEPLSRVLLDKAAGNPLFLEELGRAVRESGDLGSATTVIPSTIQDVLMARIDRLTEERKRLLQAAAVLGHDFPLPLLEAIWDGAGEPGARLRELTEAEFFDEQMDETGSVFVFRHALTQEVAYESVPLARRRALHAAAGDALERVYADRLRSVCDRLAYHYSKADDVEKAVKYLTIFASSAAQRFAHTEAVAAAREAVERAQQLTGDQQQRWLFELVLLQAHSLFLLGRLPEALAVLLEHRAQFEQGRDGTWTGRYYVLLANTYTFLGDHEEAGHTARRAIEAAARCRDEATLGKANYVLAVVSYSLGQAEEGIAFGRRAVALLEAAAERRWLGQAHWALAINYIMVGRFALALEGCRRAEEIGVAIEDPRLQKSVAWSLGYIHATLGEPAAAVEACQRSLEQSPNPLNTALGLGFLGYAHLVKGEARLAIPILEDAVARMSQFRLRQNHGWFMAFLAEAYLHDGQLDKASELARQSFDIVTKAKFLYGAGAAERTLGRIATARGLLPEAQDRFDGAAKRFLTIPAPFELARTQLDLAELAGRRGDRDGVRRHADEAIGLFKELELADHVTRAKRLLRRFGIVPTDLAS